MSKLFIANGNDPKEMAKRLLESAQPEKGLRLDTSIAIKPRSCRHKKVAGRGEHESGRFARL